MEYILLAMPLIGVAFALGSVYVGRKLFPLKRIDEKKENNTDAI